MLVRGQLSLLQPVLVKGGKGLGHQLLILATPGEGGYGGGELALGVRASQAARGAGSVPGLLQPVGVDLAEEGGRPDGIGPFSLGLEMVALLQQAGQAGQQAVHVVLGAPGLGQGPPAVEQVDDSAQAVPAALVHRDGQAALLRHVLGCHIEGLVSHRKLTQQARKGLDLPVRQVRRPYPAKGAAGHVAHGLRRLSQLGHQVEAGLEAFWSLDGANQEGRDLQGVGRLVVLAEETDLVAQGKARGVGGCEFAGRRVQLFGQALGLGPGSQVAVLEGGGRGHRGAQLGQQTRPRGSPPKGPQDPAASAQPGKASAGLVQGRRAAAHQQDPLALAQGRRCQGRRQLRAARTRGAHDRQRGPTAGEPDSPLLVGVEGKGREQVVGGLGWGRVGNRLRRLEDLAGLGQLVGSHREGPHRRHVDDLAGHMGAGDGPGHHAVQGMSVHAALGLGKGVQAPNLHTEAVVQKVQQSDIDLRGLVVEGQAIARPDRVVHQLERGKGQGGEADRPILICPAQGPHSEKDARLAAAVQGLARKAGESQDGCLEGRLVQQGPQAAGGQVVGYGLGVPAGQGL